MKTLNATLLTDLSCKLKNINKQPLNKKVMVGFDGFIDKIKKPVRQKHVNGEPEYYQTISEFAERIQAASGKSGQVEMITSKIKLGGNAPILANALGQLNIKNICIGCMGLPNKKQVFTKMNPNCELMSVLDPGLSDALEFSDGKMIFSELSVFENYNWKYLKEAMGHEQLVKIVKRCDLLAFVDWANLPWAYDIWCGMLQDVIKPSGKKDFDFVFDLCDPSKRSAEDVDEVVDLISSFSPYGRVTLCLNENEALSIWALLNGKDYLKAKSSGALPDLTTAAKFIFKTMNIERLLIHPIDKILFISRKGIIEIGGMMVKEPRVLTGGGDNLNAGYCLGVLAGFEVVECLVVAMAAAGSYIRNGNSPFIKDVIDYLDDWRQNIAFKEEELAFIH